MDLIKRIDEISAKVTDDNVNIDDLVGEMIQIIKQYEEKINRTIEEIKAKLESDDSSIDKDRLRIDVETADRMLITIQKIRHLLSKIHLLDDSFQKAVITEIIASLK